MIFRRVMLVGAANLIKELVKDFSIEQRNESN